MRGEINILHVDDESLLLDQAKIFLEKEKEGLNVITASSADKGLDLLDEADIDVIVSDYQMPKMDGLEFLEEIREERSSEIPFIIFTGKGREEVAINALNLGADRYIQKGGEPKSQYEVLKDAIVQEYEHWESKRRLEKSEKDLRKSQKKYKKIFHETPLGTFHYDEEGIITECNDEFVKIIGSSREELIGLDMLSDLNNDKLIEEVRASLEEGEGYYEGEYTSVTGDKTTSVRVFFKGMEDESGEIDSGVGLVEDITQRMEHEQELKRKEIYLDHAPAFITVIDGKGDIKYHSYPSNEITGLDPSKFMGSEAIEFAHPEDREDALEMFSKVLENPGEEYITELRGETDDGWIWLEIRAVNHLDDPEINGIIVTALDISERKKMEKKLKEREEKYRALVKSAYAGIAITDFDDNLNFVNEKFADMLGYEKEELLGKNLAEISPEKEQLKFEEETKKRKEGETNQYETRLKKKNGEMIDVMVHASPFKNSKGEFAGTIGIITDITEEKKTNKELKKSNQRYETLFEENPEAIVEVDEDSKVLRANTNFEELFGFEKEEIKGRSINDLIVPEEKLEEAEDLDKKAEEGYVKHETVRVSKDGEKLPVSITSRPIEQNEETHHIAVYHDISERKKAEKELEESEKRFRTIIENSADAIFLTDREGNYTYVNQAASDLLGYPKEELEGKNIGELSRDEDIENHLETFKKVLEEERVFTEITLVKKDGTTVPVDLNAVLLPNGVIYGSCRDITQRKKLEERIQENKDKLEKLNEISAEFQTYDSEEDVYSFAVETAEEILDFDICSFDSVEGDKFVAQAISSGVPKDGIVDRNIEESGLAKETYMHQEPYLIDDLGKDEDAEPVKSEYSSAISVPVGKKGVFQAVSTETSHFTEEDLKMAMLLANNVFESLKRIKAKEREDFLHSLLRHDVGNKIQVIQGYLQLAEEFDMPEELDDFISKANTSIKSAQEMIEKIRTLRNVFMEDEIATKEICSIFEVVISDYRDRLEEQDIELEFQKREVEVRGGPLLKEMFSNILENTIKHAGCDNIRISCEEQKGKAVVKVEDDGKGVPDDIKSELFERGFKKGESGGSGLGLYLVKEIAENYGGNVEVKDSDMSGARFDISLKKTN